MGFLGDAPGGDAEANQHEATEESATSADATIFDDVLVLMLAGDIEVDVLRTVGHFGAHGTDIAPAVIVHVDVVGAVVAQHGAAPLEDFIG